MPSSRTSIVLLVHADRHGVPARAVEDRVLDQRVERALEVGPGDPDRLRRAVGIDAQLEVVARRGRAPAHARGLGDLGGVEHLPRRVALARAAEERAARRRSRRSGRPRAAPRRARTPAPRDPRRGGPPPGAGAARSAACAAGGRRRRRTPAGERTVRPRRSVIALKDRASERCSYVPSTSARASRSPAATRWAASSRRVIGRAIPRARRNATTSAVSRTARPTARIPSIVLFTAALTRLTLCVSRTPPTTFPARKIGSALTSSSSSSVALLRSACTRRPRSVAMSSGRAPVA